MVTPNTAGAKRLAREQVVIVTVTRYDDPAHLRVPLAYQTVEMANEDGYPLVVVDGSPHAIIRKELARRGANVFPDLGSSLGSAKRQSFFHAMELALLFPQRPKIIVYIEAEKYFIIPHIPILIAPLVDQQAHVVVATRSEASWQTWPRFQVETEHEANDTFARIFKLNLDIMHGPGAFRIREAGEYFCNGALYLDSIGKFIFWSSKVPMNQG